ncbi:uncharacterized protein LOC144658301 [Oculina patagonica]
MESGSIFDKEITASSHWSNNYAAVQGRLHFQQSGVKQGAWSAGNNDVNQWLQVDLGSGFTRVTGVATQGRNAYSQWVTLYNLQYGDNGVDFQYYREHGQNVNKVFNGNADRDSVVYHGLSPPITARYIRFRPVAWHNHISMRVELYGCRDFIPGIEALCGSSYLLFTVRETWSNAQARCRSLGAELVKIESAVENKFLKSTFFALSAGSFGVTYWIGLSDQVEEGKWMWTDGSLLANYTNWGNNNPNNYGGNQNCGHMSIGDFEIGHHTFYGFHGEWNDLECDFELGYICEKIYP